MGGVSGAWDPTCGKTSAQMYGQSYSCDVRLGKFGVGQKMRLGPDIWMTARSRQASCTFSQREHIATIKSEHAYQRTLHIFYFVGHCDFGALLTLVPDWERLQNC